jgi:hypothetical protein
MSNVYGGSGLNIAATRAPDGRSGCFFKVPQNRICQVQVRLGNQILSYNCVSSRMYENCLSSMPLMERGWALQERLLPPRTLHFTSTEVFWECHEKVACETFPEQFPTSLISAERFFKKKPMSRPMWSWIIERYSECQLTKTKDKLVAISGLARIVQEQTKDQYVAGMWRKDLELQLCWFKVASSWRGQIVISYRAPTWSWASLDCQVKLWGQGPEPEDVWIRVLDVQLQHLDSDPLGQLSMAQLRLSCFYLVDVGVKMRQLDSTNPSGREGVLIVGRKPLNCWISFDRLADDESHKLQKAKAMPVCMYSAREATGLLLEPTGKQRGQYQRIGWFYFIFGCSKNSKVFLSNMIKPSYQVAEEECLEIQTDKDGRTRRIITLV